MFHDFNTTSSLSTFTSKFERFKQCSFTRIMMNFNTTESVIISRSYNDLEVSFQSVKTFTLTTPSFFSKNVFSKNCKSSNACRNVKKLFSLSNLQSWRLKFSLYNYLLRIAILFFFYYFIELETLEFYDEMNFCCLFLEFLLFNVNIQCLMKWKL